MFQFYFAFENSLCEDYITEKFWKVLNFNVIPVVLNGVNMSAVAPPHSYIDIKQFENIAGDILLSLAFWGDFHETIFPLQRLLST